MDPLGFELVERIGIERPARGRGLRSEGLSERGIFQVLAQIGFAHYRASFHGPVMLHGGDGMVCAYWLDYGADRLVCCLACAQPICIIAGAIPHTPAVLPAIAQRKPDGVVGHAGLRPGGTNELSPRQANSNQRGISGAGLLNLRLEPHLSCRFGAKQHDVLPRDARNGVR